MTRSIGCCALAMGALLAVAPALAAQAADGRAGGGFHAHVLALGSIAAEVDRPHVAGGGLVQLGYGRASVLGIGTIGRGGDYESALAGGALAVRAVTIGRVALSGFGGYGLYREEGWSGIERDASGILYGALAAVRLGRATLALALSDLTGEYGEDDVAEPFRFHVPRLSVGFGF